MAKTLSQKFSANMRRLRLEKKFSQDHLAKKAGFSTSYVSMLECGQRSPPLETIEKIAKVFKVDPRALLTA